MNYNKLFLGTSIKFKNLQQDYSVRDTNDYLNFLFYLSKIIASTEHFYQYKCCGNKKKIQVIMTKLF